MNGESKWMKATEAADANTASENEVEGNTLTREVVYQSHYRRDCGEFQLVLEAAGIPSQLTQVDSLWKLTVPSSWGAAALSELAAYQRDNVENTEVRLPPTPTFDGAFVGVFWYAFVICLIAFYVHLPAFGLPWSSLGAMQAGEMRSGQVWRVITALTLHADSQHLFSNLVFGGVFGLLVGRILGGGLAWLTIVIAGGLGNAFCGLVRESGYTSIGASTAVFAALGVMVAHALHTPGSAAGKKSPKTRGGLPGHGFLRNGRWRPVICGLLMLAFVGVEGERTDVLAHVAGFVAGWITGSIACQVPDQRRSSIAFQVTMGSITILTIVIAWMTALSPLP